MERLSAQDLLSLSTEDFGWPQDIGALGLLDGAGLLGTGGAVRVDRVRTAVAGRLHLAPRLRQVVHRAGHGRPMWVDAPGLDLADHIRVHPLPPGSGETALLAAWSEIRRRPLDRARPLWELWLLPGLAGGRTGLYFRLHHSVADGMAAVALLGALLGPGPDPAGPADPRVEDTSQPGAGWRRATAGLLHPVRTGRHIHSGWLVLREFLAEQRAPRTSLAGPVGPGQRIGLVRGDLSAVKQIARAAGGTVNDVVLAAVTGGLRDLLQARGEPVDGVVLRAAVPVSLHAVGGAARGNRTAAMAVPLPVGEADPFRRLRLIGAETARRKAALRPHMIAGVLGSTVLQRAGLRYMRHQRMVNLQVANVPGPSDPLFLAGARLTEVFPVVSPMGNMTLNVGVLSYAGQLNFAAIGDYDAVPDLPVFLTGLDRCLTTLTRAWASRPVDQQRT